MTYMPLDRKRRTILGASATLVTLGVAGCLASTGGNKWAIEEKLAVTNAQQYNSPGCSCCEQYASYLREQLDGTLSTTVPDDIAAVKREYGVPEELESCHTVDIGGYIVEGHVPAEAIAKLLDEKPSIDGIALPGMPAGSPGMGGKKSETFDVYVIGGDRTGDVYTEL